MDWTIDKEGFKLYAPQEYRPWYNYLSNDDIGLKISHLGDGFSTTLKEPRLALSHYDFLNQSKGRFIYIKEEDHPWNPSFYPTKTKLDNYSCIHAPGFTKWESSKNQLDCSATLFLPQKGSYEVCLVKVTNRSAKKKQFSLTSQIEPLLYNNFSVDPIYYSWFTNSYFDKKNHTIRFKKLHGSPIEGWYKALKKADSFESSLKNFKGNGTLQNPESLKQEALSSGLSGGDPYMGAFQYKVELEAKESQSFAFFFGTGEAEFQSIINNFSTIESVEKELQSVTISWKSKCYQKQFDSLEDEPFKNWLNTFFPYQIYQQSLGLVRSTFRGYRDVAQDSMGLSFFDKEKSQQLIFDLAEHQYPSGQCLRQWNTEGGAPDTRDFRDLPYWLCVATCHYIKQSNDLSILDVERPYFKEESDQVTIKESLLKHIIKGIEYATIIGKHQLIEMGEGDWNDALSGLGKTGGSLWLNEFAYYALEQLEEIQKRIDKTSEAFDLVSKLNIGPLKDKLYQGLMPYWTGKWFARGVTDSGEIVGGKERIFLLPQAWFTISGMAKRDPEKGKIALDSMSKKLDHSCGLLLCDPGFTEFDSRVGNLSALAPGLAENFAVYSHGTAFGLYALLMAGEKERGEDLLKRALPFYKDYHQTHSEPFVLVNYYNGGFYKEKEGQGGIPWLTSTISWLALSFFDFLFKID